MQKSPVEMLYVFAEDKRILKLYVPHSQGVKVVDEMEVTTLWGPSEMAMPQNLKHLHPETNKIKTNEWEVRKYVMTAILWLQQHGHLVAGKPSKDAKTETRRQKDCIDLFDVEMKGKFHNKYDTVARARAQNTEATNSPGTTSASSSTTNTYRNLLREKVAARVGVVKEDTIQFRSHCHDDTYLATLWIKIDGKKERFSGEEEMPTEEEAEEHVAELALLHMA